MAIRRIRPKKKIKAPTFSGGKLVKGASNLKKIAANKRGVRAANAFSGATKKFTGKFDANDKPIIETDVQRFNPIKRSTAPKSFGRSAPSAKDLSSIKRSISTLGARSPEDLAGIQRADSRIGDLQIQLGQAFDETSSQAKRSRGPLTAQIEKATADRKAIIDEENRIKQAADVFQRGGRGIDAKVATASNAGLRRPATPTAPLPVAGAPSGATQQEQIRRLQFEIALGKVNPEDLTDQQINLLAGGGSDAAVSSPVLDFLRQHQQDIASQAVTSEAQKDKQQINFQRENQLEREFTRGQEKFQAERQKDIIAEDLASRGGLRGSESSDRNREIDFRLKELSNRRLDLDQLRSDRFRDKLDASSDKERADANKELSDIGLQIAKEESALIQATQKTNADAGIKGLQAAINLRKAIGTNSGVNRKFNKDLSINSGFITYVDDFGNESVKTDEITGKPVAFAINPEDNPDFQMITSQFDGSKMLVNKNATTEEEFIVQAYNPDNTIAYTSPQNYSSQSSQINATDVIPQIDRPRNTGNVANDLNNPNNLVRGGGADKFAIGYTPVVGPKGVTREFLVFDTVENGMKGMATDFNAKVSGGSAHIRPQESLERLTDVWVGAEGASDAYQATVAQMMGVSLDTPIQNLDPVKLAGAFARAEGFTGGAPIKQTTQMRRLADDNIISAETAEDVVNNLFSIKVGQGKVDAKDEFTFKKNMRQQIKSTGGISPLVRMDDATAIKKQITNLPTLVKEIDVLSEGGSTMKSFNPETENPGEDVRLIFAYMKSIDPESVVRESEFKTAQQAVGTFAERFGQDVEQILEGTGQLSPEMRRKIINSGLQAYNSKRESYSKKVGGVESQWGKLSGGDKGLDPSIYLRYNNVNYDELVPEIKGHITIPAGLKNIEGVSDEDLRGALEFYTEDQIKQFYNIQ